MTTISETFCDDLANVLDSKLWGLRHELDFYIMINLDFTLKRELNFRLYNELSSELIFELDNELEKL